MPALFPKITSSEVKDIKSIVGLLPNEKTSATRIVQHAIDMLCTGPITKGSFVRNGNQEKVTDKGVVLLYEILQSALKIGNKKLSEENFSKELKNINIPDIYIEELRSALYDDSKRREQIEAWISKHCSSYPTLEMLQWRVDVSISTSVILRSLQPTILLQITANDGNIHRFEMTVEKFHELRSKVAEMMVELNSLSQHHILKIQE